MKKVASVMKQERRIFFLLIILKSIFMFGIEIFWGFDEKGKSFV